MNIEELGKKIGNALEDIRLSDREKLVLKSAIMREIGVPNSVSKPTPSPFLFSMFHLRAAIASVLLFFIISGSGISYAAAHALPGELLYAIKIGVNEPLQVALATTPEEKASLAVSFADQRLEEAGKLAALGRLTPTLEEQVTSEFENQANQVNIHLTTLDSTDQAAGAEISDQFEAVLSAHEVVLTRLALRTRSDGEATSSSTATNQDIALVTEKIHTQVSKLAERHMAYAESMAISTGDSNALRIATAAPKMTPQTMAISAVTPAPQGTESDVSSATPATSSPEELSISSRMYEKANTVYVNAKSSLKGATIADASRRKAEKELAAIGDLLKDAKASIAAEDADTARRLAREALRRGVAFGVYLNAENYDNNFPGTDSEDVIATSTPKVGASSTKNTLEKSE